MNFRQVYALMRRHLVALGVLLVLTMGLAVQIKHTRPVYTESANVIFTVPAVNPYTSISSFTSDLLITAYSMTQVTLSPPEVAKIRAAGGTGDFTVGLVNFNNQQFPYFGGPYVTVTATSGSLDEAHRTFEVVAQSFQRIIAERQTSEGVPPIARITTQVVADSGPVSPAGSQKRALAGLIMLALVVTFLVLIFLDRHPIWPGIRRRLSSGQARRAFGSPIAPR